MKESCLMGETFGWHVPDVSIRHDTSLMLFIVVLVNILGVLNELWLLRTFWRYTNAVIIIVTIIDGQFCRHLMVTGNLKRQHLALPTAAIKQQRFFMHSAEALAV